MDVEPPKQEHPDRQTSPASTKATALRLLAILMLVAAIILMGILAWRVLDKSDDTSTATTIKSQPSTGTPDNQSGNVENPNDESGIDAQNADRKSDAAALASRAKEHRARYGAWPTGYAESALTGPGSGSTELELAHYNTVSVVSGDQPPLTEDQLRFIANAKCAAEGSTVDDTEANYTVQYMLEGNDGTFEAICQLT